METNVLNALTPNTSSLGDDHSYSAFIEHLKKTLLNGKRAWGNALFRSTPMTQNAASVNEVVPVDLGQVFLNSLPDSRRQHYTCRCCLSFIQRYGDVVFIDEEGKARSAIWDAVTFQEDNFFYSFVSLMQSMVEKAKVTDSFKTEFRVLGQPLSGGWNHMYVELPDDMVTVARYMKNAGQQAAVVRQDFEMLSRRLAEPRYSLDVLTQLQTILEADVLANQNVIKGPATFLFKLAKSRDASKNQRVRDNLVWLAAATSSAGLMHSDVCDNILSMIAEGKDFDFIKKVFGKITRADTYRRPEAPPAEGAVDAAEKFFVENGLVESLRRRLAVAADVPENVIIWKPVAVEKEEAPTSVFGHLKTPAKTAADNSITLPRTNMSWNKFTEEVLPKVLALEIKIPVAEFFAGIATAAVAESPCLFFYEHQASPYAKMGTDGITGKPLPVPAANWNLQAGSWCDVGMIIPMPFMWTGMSFAHMKEQILFAIPGAYDTASVDKGQSGNALFPQLLKSDFHPYSSVVEAYANKAPFEGLTKDQLAGLSLTRGQAEQRLLRVTTELGQREIMIDRWE